MKRIVFVISLILLLSFVCYGEMYTYTIAPGEEIDVTVTGEGVLVKAVPEVGGEYWFESVSPYDTKCLLFKDSPSTDSLYESDDEGEGGNFRLKYTLKAGETYFYQVKIPDDISHRSLSFKVKLTMKNPEAGHVHQWVETVKQAPTCTEAGIMSCSCFCTMTKETAISPLGHSGEESIIEASCTMPGTKTVICSLCGNTEVTEIPALGHSFSPVFVTDKNPTCTTEGSESFHCIRCDISDSKTVQKIPANGHTYGEWYVLKKPTCTAVGTNQRECKVCFITDTISTPATGHKFGTTYIIDKAATCTANGEKSYHCTYCGEVKPNSETTIVATGHNYSGTYTVDKAATCTKAGTKSFHCSKCNDKTGVTSIPAKGHTIKDEKVTVKPTCTTNGEKQGTCSVCKTKVTVSIAKLGHKYSEYKQTKAPTCTANGTKTSTCANCKAVRTQSIAKLGHKYSTKYTVDKKASTDSAGSKTKHCSRCDSKIDKLSIAKISTVKLNRTLYIYNGNSKKPSVTIKDSNGKTVKSCTITYDKNCATIGTHYVTVKFSGEYTGTKKLSYKIVPDTVESIKVSTNGSKITLKWNSVKGAGKYNVYNYNSATKTYVLIGSTTKTSYTAQLKNGKTYKLAVKAVKTVNKKDYVSAEYSKVTAVTAPKNVTLKASAGTKQATLSWNIVDGSGYEVYMSDKKDSGYTLVKTMNGANAVSYTRTRLATGKTYYFRVRAFTKSGDMIVYSPYSNVVPVKIK